MYLKEIFPLSIPKLSISSFFHSHSHSQDWYIKEKKIEDCTPHCLHYSILPLCTTVFLSWTFLLDLGSMTP